MRYNGMGNKVGEKISELKAILYKHWISVSVIFCTSILLIIVYVYDKKGVNFFRLDQYAETICTTTAGVVGTMFGLTAASYAFRCGDLRNESQEKPHLQKILGIYMEGLWLDFIYSLVFTTITILSSLMILFFMQQFTSPISYRVYGNLQNRVMEYFTIPEKWICCGVTFNFVVALSSIIIMVLMNRSIFKREKKHVRIAIEILNKIQDTYDFNVDVSFKDTLYEEYEKIHNLEIIIKRILKNHESMGDAFAEEQRREKLLTVLINHNLNSEFGFTKNKIPCEAGEQYWSNLDEQKRKARWNQCFFIAKRDYDCILANRRSDNINIQGKLKPVECNFIKVYDDLLTYRDSKLVINQSSSTVKLDGRALRYTIKKRLLLFHLRGEEFSDMDLSRISFSGADLRYTNFAGSNLSGVRLKGTNCQGADFSRVKMPGMFFWEKREEFMGEVPVTCIDDNKKDWDIYGGKEITCFEEATFTDADVSRAYLDASNAERFSLIGTNFDRAKMFSSLFNHFNFTNASLEQAQMYNSVFINIIAESSNFSKSVMTRSCISGCNFINANFEETSLVETILYDSLFVGAKLASANFSYSNILSCDFEGASCQNVSFKNIVQDITAFNNGSIKALRKEEFKNEKSISFKFATLTRTDFSGADLSRTDFRNAIGSECIFTMTKGKWMIFNNAMLIDSVFNAVLFEYCSFINTIMRNSIIISSSFMNCTFEGTDFSEVLFDMKNESCFMGGKFVDVDFSNCHGIQAKHFKNCILMNVDFSGTGLSERDFESNVRLVSCIFV